jgi:cell division protein FtsI (penicillin-binding protein 3)
MTGRAATTRLNVVAALCVLPLVAVVLRVAWLQGVKGDELRARADSQHEFRVRIPPHRGAVTDRNGEPLAYTMTNYSIVADPSQVTDPARTARTLASALDTSPARIERLLRSKRREVYLERKVTPMLDRRVDIESLPGISERIELKRVYPQGEFAAHVVGFVDAAGEGMAGIEAEYDGALRGQPGWATELRDGRGNSYQALGRRHKPAVPGHDVVLTIDSALQDVAASELRRQVEKLHAKGGVFVAVDPATGEILAMVSWPSFNPERVRNANRRTLRNRVITDPYEPGSTYKLVAASTALTDHLLEPGTPIDCEEGRYNFGGYVITDHHPYGIETFLHAFAVSSNIAFAKIGKLCGTRLYDMARALGFGATSGVSLPGESAGVLRSPEHWSKRSAATQAIGYEVMVTPMQLVMAYAAVANDGVLMRPQLVKAITDGNGRVVYQGRPEAVRRVLEPATARTLRRFMREVMIDGTGSGVDLDWVQVGGKTGTSEKLVDGHYTPSKHYASFVGMAPIDDPKIVCLVMIDEPRGSTFGASAAAPVFREVLDASGRLPGALLAPDYATVRVAPETSTRNFLLPDSLEAGRHDPDPPVTPSPDSGTPDVRGLSLRRALLVLRAYGMDAKVTGSGRVQKQSPPPGSALYGRVDLYCGESGTGGMVTAPDQAVNLKEDSDRRNRGPSGLR